MNYLDLLKPFDGGQNQRPEQGDTPQPVPPSSGGRSVPLPDNQADDLPIVIEPAMKPDGSPLALVFWERSDGSIVGPAQPEHFAKAGNGDRDEDFWIIAMYQDAPVWIRSDRLRSKRQFETQRPVQPIEPIRSVKGDQSEKRGNRS